MSEYVRLTRRYESCGQSTVIRANGNIYDGDVYEKLAEYEDIGSPAEYEELKGVNKKLEQVLEKTLKVIDKAHTDIYWLKAKSVSDEEIYTWLLRNNISNILDDLLSSIDPIKFVLAEV